jgi:hypothetical protein
MAGTESFESDNRRNFDLTSRVAGCDKPKSGKELPDA